MSQFNRESILSHPVENAFAWHERRGTFRRLLPPWQRVEVVQQPASLADGVRGEFLIGGFPFRMHWVSEHAGYVPGEKFEDVQLRGPFSSWRHVHRFESVNGDKTRLSDEISYQLPFGWLGETLAGRFVRKELERAFEFRHRRTAHDLERHSGSGPTLSVGVTGSTGLIGSALAAFLEGGGHEVRRMARIRARDGAYWNPEKPEVSGLDGVDAVVHLAAKSIGDWMWTEHEKRVIRDSRIVGTRTLCEALAGMSRRPKVLISSSAVGFYGDRGEEELVEESSNGRGFLADVCADWEAATEPAREAGIRVVNLRTGIVIAGAGGALPRLALAVKLGVAGAVGGGSQWVSWIALDDLVAVILRLMREESVEGPVNVVAPSPVTNRKMIDAMGTVFRRPTVLPLPARVVKTVFGQMGVETLLYSQKVSPAVLNGLGFDFFHADFESGLRMEFGRFEK